MKFNKIFFASAWLSVGFILCTNRCVAANYYIKVKNSCPDITRIAVTRDFYAPSCNGTQTCDVNSGNNNTCTFRVAKGDYTNCAYHVFPATAWRYVFHTGEAIVTGAWPEEVVTVSCGLDNERSCKCNRTDN
jgi:hypothetical protein